MLKLDDANWPIVEATVKGVPSPDEIRAYSEQLTEFLDSGEHVGLLLVTDGYKRGQGRESIEVLMEWHEEHHDLVKEWCVGVAFVFESALQSAFWSPILAAGAERIFGCPARAFSKSKRGTTWLNEQFEKLA